MGGRRAAGLAAASLVLILDQISKAIAAAELNAGYAVRVLGDFLRLSLRLNEGAAFSLSWGGPTVLTILSGVAVAGLVFFIVRGRLPGSGVALSLGCILGGAAGNLIDRLARGAVIDFIDIGTSSWRWPTFNAADIAITVGGTGLIVCYYILGRSGNARREEGCADGSE